MSKALTTFYILLVATAALVASPAAAYVDPSTSGFVMQLAAPILIAAGVLRNRIKLIINDVLARIFKHNSSSEE